MEPTWYKEQCESEQEEFRNFIKQQLWSGVVDIEFIKKDGTVRNMQCTLKSDLVKDYEKKTDKVKEVSTDVCPVFDIDKQEWRSFRYDSVKSISGKL